MNNRTDHTDPPPACARSSRGRLLNESKYLFRVFAGDRILAGTPASEVGTSAGFIKITVTGWIKTVDKQGFEALRPKPKSVAHPN